MPRTKQQPESTPLATANGPVVGEVLTLAEAAAYLRVSEDEPLPDPPRRDAPPGAGTGAGRHLRQVSADRVVSTGKATLVTRDR